MFDTRTNPPLNAPDSARQKHRSLDDLHDSARLAAIVESSDDAIIGKTLDGRIVSWNKGAERIFGYTAGDVVGRNIALLIPPDRIDEEPKILDRLRNGERVEHFDTVRVCKDGRFVHVSLTISPIRNQSGRIVGASKIARDISDRKAAEENDRIRDAELAHLSRISTMGNMAAGLAHELNQPLAAILNYAAVSSRLASATAHPDSRLMEALESLMDETRRAGAIISRMRTFVTRGTPKSVRVSLNELISKAVALLEFECRQANVRMTVKLTGDDDEVFVDVVQIQQVIVNLIYNAVQAMTENPAGGRDVRVEVRTLPTRMADISVIDSGPGMTQQSLCRLFQPFFTTKPTGMGMGLNISRSIVESHGGAIHASAETTGGMRFSFTLPIVSRGR